MYKSLDILIKHATPSVYNHDCVDRVKTKADGVTGAAAGTPKVQNGDILSETGPNAQGRIS